MSVFVRKNWSVLKRFGSYSRMKGFLSNLEIIREHCGLWRDVHCTSHTSNYDNISRRSFYSRGFDFETYLKRNQNPDDEILQQYAVRDFLYPETNDQLMESLNNCKSIQDVLNFIKNDAHQMKPEHIARSVLILWDLQKMFFDAYQVSVSQNVVVRDHLSHVLEHQDFKTLLTLLDKNVDHMNPEALSFMLLYLNKMGLSLQTEVLEKIVFKLQDLLKSGVSLTTLSLFIVTASEESSLSACYLARDAFPFILQQLEKCKTVDDFKLITICLNGLRDMVTDDILDIYNRKVRYFLDQKLLDSKNLRTIFKILTFLSYSGWNEKTTTLTSEVMLLLRNNLHRLSVNDLVIPYMVLCKNQEPGILLSEFQSAAVELWGDVHEDPLAPMHIKTKLLTYALYFTDHSNCSDFERIVSTYLKKPLDRTSIIDILKILLIIKSSKILLYNQVWTKLADKIRSEKSDEDEHVLLHCCRKYVDFYNSTYLRNSPFEKQMTVWLSKKVRNGTIEIIPSKLAPVASFLLLFGSDETLMDWCVNKVMDNCEQFNGSDCLTLSRSWYGMELIKNPLVDSKIVNRALDKCVSYTSQNLKNFNESVRLIKACAYRKRLFDKFTIDKLLLTLGKAPVVSSISIRDITSGLTITKALLPETLNKISDYVIRHKDNLLGFNAVKIAHLFYALGYLPQNDEEFFKSLIDVVERDQERLSTYSYLQFALALCFFKKLPTQYLEDIFNEEVLAKIDEELKTYYFKDTYIRRVRDLLMQLNRAACIDYPELDIPWFHYDYLGKSMKKRVQRKPSPIVAEVKPYLQRIVKNKKYLLENQSRNFGYDIDFLIEMDENKEFVEMHSVKNRTLLAILVPSAREYTYNNEQLNGEFQLKVRHLQSEDCQVAVVKSSSWRLLITHQERMNYLKDLLGRNDTESADSSVCFGPS